MRSLQVGHQRWEERIRDFLISFLEPHVGVVMQKAKDVTLDFGNGTKRDLVVYDHGIFIGPQK